MNIEELKKSALKVKELFAKYSKVSEEAVSAFKQNENLIEDSISGKITEPTWKRIESGYFVKGDELPEYHDLFEAVAELGIYLRGFNSIEEFEMESRKKMKKARAKQYGKKD